MPYEPLLAWFESLGYGFQANSLSVAYSSLCMLTLLIVGKYSRQYLKGETGADRFWMLFFFFAAGMFVSIFAKNIATFYIGWEMVGLASFFLIAFYEANPRSIENSLIMLSNYKMCDVFFVLAIFCYESKLDLPTGFFLILATLAKSAQFPFSSWLYRALEGPTPSSTLFYGGLSLHLGPFLLIQFSDLWDQHWVLRALLAGIGAVSAVYGFLAGASRSDLKTSFAFASISQVGLIYIEIAMGFYNLALVHMIGHNLLRTWNYLRGMSFFEDFFQESFHQDRAKSPTLKLFQLLPKSFHVHGLNNWYLDQIYGLLRDGSLVGVILASFIFPFYHQEFISYEYLVLVLAVLLSTVAFLSTKLPAAQFLGLAALSQFLLLLAIHGFYDQSLEEIYIAISMLSLILLIFSLRPALVRWNQKGILAAYGERVPFLGMRESHKIHHLLFLFSALFLTGAPATFEFFLTEGILTDLWGKSHLFLFLVLVCLTVNTVNVFRIGQRAFLGGP